MITLILWHHVPTDDNPSDMATRSKTLKPDLDKSQLWFEGPEWLKGPESAWPQINIDTQTLDDDPEVKIIAHVSVCDVAHPIPILVQNVFIHYSSFTAI